MSGQLSRFNFRDRAQRINRASGRYPRGHPTARARGCRVSARRVRRNKRAPLGFLAQLRTGDIMRAVCRLNALEPRTWVAVCSPRISGASYCRVFLLPGACACRRIRSDALLTYAPVALRLCLMFSDGNLLENAPCTLIAKR